MLQLLWYHRGMADVLDTIREAMAASEKTRYRIAKDLGIAQSQLSRLANGEHAMSIANASKVAEYLGLEIIVRPKVKRKAR